MYMATSTSSQESNNIPSIIPSPNNQRSNNMMNRVFDPDSNVYIAGLPRNFNKDKLWSLFASFGNILRHKFVSPEEAEKCPYGFVQFASPQQAQSAIKALNGSKLTSGEVIEVSIAAVGRRVLSLDGEPTNLYIENMPNQWNNDQLMRIFGQYGNIIQSKISGNNVAFVRFETHSQALEAIDNLHGSQFDDTSHKPLSVRFATCQHKKAKDAINKSRRHHRYINNTLNQDNTSSSTLSLSSSSLLSNKSHQSLSSYPSPYSSHSHTTSPSNSSRVRSQQHTFNHLAPRMSSISSINSSNKCQTPSSSPKGTNENNLYIKNLPQTYNQLDLESLFSKYGAISSATIINDSVGVAFVRYRHSKDAKLAIKELNGKQLFKHGKEIVVKYAYSDIDSPSIQIQQKQRNNKQPNNNNPYQLNNNSDINNVGIEQYGATGSGLGGFGVATHGFGHGLGLGIQPQPPLWTQTPYNFQYPANPVPLPPIQSCYDPHSIPIPNTNTNKKSIKPMLSTSTKSKSRSMTRSKMPVPPIPANDNPYSIQNFYGSNNLQYDDYGKMDNDSGSIAITIESTGCNDNTRTRTIICGYLRRECPKMEMADVLIWDLISNYFSVSDNSCNNRESDIGSSDDSKIDSIFSDLDNRISSVDGVLDVISTNITGFEYKMNNLYGAHQQQRDYEMNLMQNEFTAIIDDIWSNVNGQMNKISHRINDQQLKENNQLNKLEQDVKYLNIENISYRLAQQNMEHQQHENITSYHPEFVANKNHPEFNTIKTWLIETCHLTQDIAHEYAHLFIDNGFDDISIISDITESELESIGISKMGHRKKILKYAVIERQQQTFETNNNSWLDQFCGALIEPESPSKSGIAVSVSSPRSNNKLLTVRTRERKKSNSIGSINENEEYQDNDNHNASTETWTCNNCRYQNVVSISTLNGSASSCTLCGHELVINKGDDINSNMNLQSSDDSINGNSFRDNYNSAPSLSTDYF